MMGFVRQREKDEGEDEGACGEKMRALLGFCFKFVLWMAKIESN